MDYQEKTAVITGASSGIGLWTARGLAQRGMSLVIVCRDRARGRLAQEWLWREVPNAQCELLAADLSLVSAVRMLAAELQHRYERIDLLINNAGLVTRHREETAEGHELTWAVNYLAPFVLTLELLPQLRRAGAARIVNVASASADNARLDLDDLQSRHGRMVRAYGQSKLALLLFSLELARRLEHTGVSVNALHPGMAATKIGDIGGITGIFWRLLRPFMRSPAAGARAVLHAACAPELEGVTGQYFRNRHPAAPNPLAEDRALADRLWDVSLQMTGVAGFPVA